MLKPIFLAALIGFWLTAPALAVNVIDYIPADQQALLLTTGVPHADPYVAAAQAALGTQGGEVDFPPGTLLFDGTIHTATREHLSCQGGGLSGSAVTTLSFPASVGGISLDHEGDILEGCLLQGSGIAGNGVTLTQRASVIQDIIRGFGGNCIDINSRTGNNLNGWFTEAVRCNGEGGDGEFIAGANANAGIDIALNVSNIGGIGIDDESFLGNVHLAPQVAAAGGGPYAATGSTNPSTFIGAYSESGEPSASLNSNTIYLGGLAGAGVTGGFRMSPDNMTPFALANVGPNHTLKLGLANTAAEFFDMAVSGAEPNTWSFYWDNGSSTIELRDARSASRVALALTTDLGTQTDESGAAIGQGKMLVNDVWAKVSGNKYRDINFLADDTAIKAAQANVATLQGQVAALTARLAAAGIP